MLRRLKPAERESAVRRLLNTRANWYPFTFECDTAPDDLSEETIRRGLAHNNWCWITLAATGVVRYRFHKRADRDRFSRAFKTRSPA